jgi:hypothetical protein
MSNFGKLDWKDLGKGLIIAVLTVIFSSLITTLEAGILPKWAEISTALIAGLAAGLAYLLKNLVTNSDNKLIKTEKK